MNLIKKNLGMVIGAGLGIFLVLVVHLYKPMEAHAQSGINVLSSKSAGDWSFKSLNVGLNTDNTTNVATFWANDGTNFIQISPTNATLVFSQTNGTPASNTVVKWIAVKLQGDTSAYRIGLSR